MKSKVSEITILRSLACLSVVLIHAITRSPANFESENTIDVLVSYLQLLLMYGTPMFVFISEFVIVYNYRDKIPNQFIFKRVKFILLPYICMGIFYAIQSNYMNGLDAIVVQSIRHIVLGEFHGYFVLIIFQFYFLHMIFNKVEKFLSPKFVLVAALLINVIYLGFFNFVPPFDIPYANDIWYYYSWMPFPGWIIYFFIGYYAGTRYEEFKTWLNKNQKWIISSWIVTGTTVILFQYFEILTMTSSKRVDVLLFTICTILVLFQIASQIKHVPKALILINKYSFGIYLLHPFFHRTISNMILEKFPQFSTLFGSISIDILVGILCPIPVVYLLNKTKIGPYMIGKVRVNTKPKLQNQEVYRTKAYDM
ncbi:acyltransferase family protein [Bacillus sp. TL12]|uniref:acyltransferase family protein n=1 Tax=Bacillus sp. TL12 TaxID=2894756 RepID=UPI001F51A152|nr:acyltransferase family protein [Bacillus sp. TL12]MCI0766520.1 acyltransferase family protein [Bacillus sp. TL12]